MTERRASCDQVLNPEIPPEESTDHPSSPPHFGSEEAINPPAVEIDTHVLETLPLVTETPNLPTIQFFPAKAEVPSSQGS